MIDTSIIERKIKDQVMDLCFEAIVTEAFISGLPINQGELTDGLTQGFVGYATECLKDLGSVKLLKEAMETPMGVAQKAYIKKMYDICYETATTVTARILEENKNDDKALKEAADKVTLTPSEYERFSKAAATLTPDSLSKMIQQKTLETIKEEQEAYKKDAELETELVNALNTVKDEEIEDNVDSDVPPAMEPGGDASTGEDIGQSDDSGMPTEEEQPAPLNESYTMDTRTKMRAIAGVLESDFTEDQNASKKDPARNPTGDEIGTACDCPEHQKEEAAKDPVKRAAGHTAGSQVGMQGAVPQAKGDGACDIGMEVDISSIKRRANALGFRIKSTYYGGSKRASAADAAKYYKSQGAVPLTKDEVKKFEQFAYSNPQAYSDALNLGNHKIEWLHGVPMWNTNESGDENVYLPMIKTKEYDKLFGFSACIPGEYPSMDKTPASESYGVTTTKTAKSTAAMDSYLKSIAGENYRTKHSSVFSKIQELAYEGVLATTESYQDIPFETMAAITKENTFERFNSHRTKDLQTTMESVARYDFAQEGFFGSLQTVFRTLRTWKVSPESKKKVENMSREEKIGHCIRAFNWTTNGRGALINDSGKLKELANAIKELYPQAKLKITNYGNIAAIDVIKGFVGSNAQLNERGFDIIGIEEGLSDDSVMFLREKMGNGKYTEVYTLEPDMISHDAGVSLDLAKKGKLPATEAAGIPDGPEQTPPPPPPAPGAPVPPPPPAAPSQDKLQTGLLVASIIYTFFETLNSMNLYCPKLAEIRNFVDENLPIKERVALDKKAFMDLLNKVVRDASAQVRVASTVPEVDTVQKDLDIVREKMAAPGFEGIRQDIDHAIESLQTLINQRRDYLVEKQRPVTKAVEGYFDTITRTRDALKFDRVASTIAKKPNIVSIRCKVDPQGRSKYVAVEAYNASGSVANRTTVVLESNMDNLVDYVESSIKSSKIMDCGKKILLSDARSGKIYLDTSR